MTAQAQTLIEAANELAETLSTENEHLAAMDLAQAVTVLKDKQRTMAAFESAQARTPPASLSPEARRHAAQLATRLRELVHENRRLLERGLAVQTRVVTAIARAVPAATRGAPSRYGANGDLTKSRRAEPLAISANV